MFNLYLKSILKYNIEMLTIYNLRISKKIVVHYTMEIFYLGTIISDTYCKKRGEKKQTISRREEKHDNSRIDLMLPFFLMMHQLVLNGRHTAK